MLTIIIILYVLGAAQMYVIRRIDESLRETASKPSAKGCSIWTAVALWPAPAIILFAAAICSIAALRSDPEYRAKIHAAAAKLERERKS